MNTIIINRFKEIIKNLEHNENSIIVAKGINLDDIGLSKINVDKYMKNKREYTNRLNNGVKIISYDEFLLFNDILKFFYQTIYIIDNNLYLNYYPINADLNENILNCLLKHFDRENDDDFLLMNNIDDYTNAYGDVLYVDATPSGKFQPDVTNTRIQVNTGTKLVMPANGDKAVVTLHKKEVF